MSQDRDRQANMVRHWLRLGLLLVVVFLGHDVLMALEARAAPHSIVEAMHDGASAHATPDTHTAPHAASPQSEHPGQCGVGTTALPRGLAAFPHVVQVLLPVDWSLDGIAALTQQRAALVWEEPHWPPGTQRALWQVYRI